MPYTASSARDQSAQIMMQAAQNFTKGVQEYFQKQEQRQKQEATIDWLEQSGTANSLFPQLGQVQDPAERRKVITAGIKGAGLENLVQVQQFMAQQEQRTREAQAMAEMRAVQMERIRQQMAAGQTEAAALRAAADPAAPMREQIGAGASFEQLDPRREIDRSTVYLQQGGRDPQMAALLSRQAPSDPKVMMVQDEQGRPHAFLVPRSGQPQRVGSPAKEPAAARESQLGVLVRERDAARAAGRDDVAAEYDRVIADYGKKVDLFGNSTPTNPPSGGNPTAPEPKTKEELLALVRTGKLAPDQAKAIAAKNKW